MLPIHPQPRPNEILSSWMVRLAFANGFPLHTFYSALLGYKAPIWNRDTDRHPSPALLERLSQSTDQSLPDLHALTLSAYDGMLFEQLPTIGDAIWILPVGIFHRTRKRGGMQYCPLCLKYDPIPYYRRSWRLALYAICEHHYCLMQEFCPACHAPIAFHRHGIGRGKRLLDQPLRLCHRCRFDLGQSEPIYLPWPDAHSLLMLVSTIRFFEQGTWRCGGLALPCAQPFFQGLRALIGTLGGCHGQRLRQVLGTRLGVPLLATMPHLAVDFEYLEASHRLIFLLTVFWLLSDWPTRFISACLDAGFTRSRLAENIDALPFWLSSVADTYLDYRPYLSPTEEIVAAGQYLRSRHIDITPATLGGLLGLPKDRASQAWRRWQSQCGIGNAK